MNCRRWPGYPLSLIHICLTLARYEQHTIDVVLDRLEVKATNRQRLTESVESALKLTRGVVSFLFTESDELEQFSEKLACTDCGLSFSELAPRDFSFNSPYGACPVCTGLGTRYEVDPDLVVPDDTPVSYTHLDVYKRQVTSVPSSSTSPLEGSMMRIRARPVVDLPQPDSPTSPRVSPS